VTQCPTRDTGSHIRRADAHASCHPRAAMELSSAQLAGYRRDGYLMCRSVFDRDSVAALSAVARADPAVIEAAASSAKQIKLW
jgi:hypothetical protein